MSKLINLKALSDNSWSSNIAFVLNDIRLSTDTFKYQDINCYDIEYIESTINYLYWIDRWFDKKYISLKVYNYLFGKIVDLQFKYEYYLDREHGWIEC